MASSHLWYYLDESGFIAKEKGPFTESQLIAIVREGAIKKSTRIRSPTRTDNREVSVAAFPKLAALIVESPDAAPPPIVPPLAYSYTKDPRALTSFLIIMLWVSLGFEIISILSDYGQWSLLFGAFTEAEAAANDSRQRLIGLGYFGVHIVTGIAFLKWIYRANLNCRGFGAEGMRFTPGWSIGCYFIPFLNLVWPYLSMKEIWQVSHNPSNWKSQSGSWLVGWWWAFWLISGFLSQMVSRLSRNADSIDELKGTTALSMLLSIFVGIPLCLLAIDLVKTVSSKQESIVNNG